VEPGAQDPVRQLAVRRGGEVLRVVDISFVVPLYNTGEGLPVLIQSFAALRLQKSWELILVDDGSVDGTGERAAIILQDLPLNAKLVQLSRNYGEHAAVMEGYRQSQGEIVVNLDDDLQTPLEEALRLIDQLEHSTAEVIYADYRQHKAHHWMRNLGSRAVNRMASLLLGKPKDLYLSSFRAVRRGLVRRVLCYRGPYPYIDGLILGATDRIESLSVKHRERAHGQSTYTMRKLLRLTMTVLFDFNIMPLRIASLLGLLLCLSGLGMTLAVLVEKATSVDVQTGWSSLMAAAAIFSGAQLLLLGLLGEYVGRSYLTLSGKPQCHVRTVCQTQPKPETV
jgi:undecaprenyl-phosphate 4-deoxy-4-formamido-L-arabinose transferase